MHIPLARSINSSRFLVVGCGSLAYIDAGRRKSSDLEVAVCVGWWGGGGEFVDYHILIIEDKKRETFIYNGKSPSLL